LTLQAIIALVYLSIVFLIFEKSNPYQDLNFNWLNKLSLLVATLSVFSGTMVEIYDNPVDEIYHSVLQAINSLFLVFINALFVYYFIKGILIDVYPINFENKCCFCFFLCKNKNRLLKIKLKEFLKPKIEELQNETLNFYNSLEESSLNKIEEIKGELREVNNNKMIDEYNVPDKIKKFLLEEYKKLSEAHITKVLEHCEGIIEDQKSKISLIDEIRKEFPLKKKTLQVGDEEDEDEEVEIKENENSNENDINKTNESNSRSGKDKNNEDEVKLDDKEEVNNSKNNFISDKYYDDLVKRAKYKNTIDIKNPKKTLKFESNSLNNLNSNLDNKNFLSNPNDLDTKNKNEQINKDLLLVTDALKTINKSNNLNITNTENKEEIKENNYITNPNIITTENYNSNNSNNDFVEDEIKDNKNLNLSPRLKSIILTNNLIENLDLDLINNDTINKKDNNDDNKVSRLTSEREVKYHKSIYKGDLQDDIIDNILDTEEDLNINDNKNTSDLNEEDKI